MDWSGFYAPGWHPLLEALAYLCAGLLYRAQRRRLGDVINTSNRLSVIVAAVVGAALGSKLLHHLASPAEVAVLWEQGTWSAFFAHLAGGKTIVGALLGGWLTVEIVKRRLGIIARTGDLFVLPLLLGMMIGRVGCLLAGPMDDTSGIETTLPWGIHYGDGILHHPMALYEIVFLAGIFALFLRRQRLSSLGSAHLRFRQEGDGFRLFLLSYLCFRLLADFWKDYQVFYGLRILQWACLLGIAALLRDLFKVSALPDSSKSS